VAGTCECIDELSGSIKCWEFVTILEPVSSSRKSLLHAVGKEESKQVYRV
jgi:hypothetical protein